MRRAQFVELGGSSSLRTAWLRTVKPLAASLLVVSLLAAVPCDARGNGARPNATEAASLTALPLAEVEESDGRPHVTFVGFQPLEGGGARVFVHLTGSPSNVRSSKGDKRVIISLEGIGIGARNNKYPLDLQNFALPVTHVQLKARDSSVDIELSLRRELTLNPRLQRRPDGAVVLELEIPAS